ncbi:MAG: sigma-70 family RNA polymerase sigma factor [Gemmatimonadota bacterium]
MTLVSPMDESLSAQIEFLVRRESARLISVLTRILGPQNLELAEDVLQESFMSAMEVWSTQGIPDNPPGWLLTTARNRAIDAIRRERTRATFAPDLALFLEGEWTLTRAVDHAFEEDWARDDQLRMIFMCCHPRLAPENRLPLILKTMCGLSVPAIARALLTTESTINKRLYRTRRALKGVEFLLPSPEELPGALETVHTVLYLLFNEGSFSTTEVPILREMCRDAISLTQLLVDEPQMSNGNTVALLALMCFAAARFDSRVDESGQPIPLDEQNRTLWDQALIRRGLGLLNRSSQRAAGLASRYHLEAAIAARHCGAKTFGATDWHSICNLYDRLLEVYPSPLTRLNRAVAISYRGAPEDAIPIVEQLRGTDQLPHSNVVAAVLANLYARAGDGETASRFREVALAQANSPHERRMIR